MDQLERRRAEQRAVRRAQFAAHPQPRARLEVPQLAAVEMDEAQRRGQAAAVGDRGVDPFVDRAVDRLLDAHGELPAAAIAHLVVADDRVELDDLAVARIGQTVDARLVLVAHRQVQHAVEIVGEADPREPRGERRTGGRFAAASRRRLRARHGRSRTRAHAGARTIAGRRAVRPRRRPRPRSSRRAATPRRRSSCAPGTARAPARS